MLSRLFVVALLSVSSLWAQTDAFAGGAAVAPAAGSLKLLMPAWCWW